MFEIYAVFTCYLSYYKPSTKISWFGAPRARWHAGAPAEWIFNVIFEIYAVFTCYLTYYKPSTKISWFGARAGAPAETIFNVIFEITRMGHRMEHEHMTDTGRTPDGHRTDTGRTYGDPRGVIGGLLYEAESIFNVIFEIYAVFTCYLTYYKPSAKKSW